MSILDDIDVQIDRFDKLIEAINNIIVDKYDCATRSLFKMSGVYI